MITTVITIFLGKLTCNCMSVFFLSLSVTLYHLTFPFPPVVEKTSRFRYHCAHTRNNYTLTCSQ